MKNSRKIRIFRLNLSKSTKTTDIETTLNNNLQKKGQVNSVELLRIDQLKNETVVFFAGIKNDVRQISSSLKRKTKSASLKLKQVDVKELMKFPK